MDKDEKLIYIGKYNPRFNDILGLEIGELDIYRSKGLSAHLAKRAHYNCMEYIDSISEIIENPDYIGVNPNEKGTSLELIKRYDDNVLIGIKLDSDKEYLYVSTLHTVQESKITRRMYSGRIKEYSVDKVDKEEKE